MTSESEDIDAMREATLSNVNVPYPSDSDDHDKDRILSRAGYPRRIDTQKHTCQHCKSSKPITNNTRKHYHRLLYNLSHTKTIIFSIKGNA